MLKLEIFFAIQTLITLMPKQSQGAWPSTVPGHLSLSLKISQQSQGVCPSASTCRSSPRASVPHPQVVPSSRRTPGLQQSPSAWPSDSRCLSSPKASVPQPRVAPSSPRVPSPQLQDALSSPRATSLNLKLPPKFSIMSQIFNA